MGINEITALGAIAALLLVARGFLPLVQMWRADFLGYVASGLTISSVSLLLRMTHWDILRTFVSDDVWLSWRTVTGGVAVNALPNLGVMIGCVCLLKARWLLIPEEDRGDWNLITAPFYPARRCIAVIFARRGLWARKKGRDNEPE